VLFSDNPLIKYTINKGEGVGERVGEGVGEGAGAGEGAGVGARAGVNVKNGSYLPICFTLVVTRSSKFPTKDPCTIWSTQLFVLRNHLFMRRRLFCNILSMQHFVHATFCPRNHLSMRQFFCNVLSLQHFVHATFCPQQFVRNILSATICPRHFVLQRFVLRHFVHATFCPQHFVRDILSCDIQS